MRCQGTAVEKGVLKATWQLLYSEDAVFILSVERILGSLPL